MKRILAFMLTVAFAMGLATGATAMEINVKGDFHYAFVWNDNPDFSTEPHDTFWARSRVRITTEFIASENLKGVLHLSTKLIYWGNEEGGGPAPGGGGQLDTTKAELNVHQAYIDWTVPDTGLNVKMGLQYLFLPMAVSLSPVMNTAVAGVNVTNQFNDNVSASLGWFRPWNGSAVKDAWDMFVVTVPMQFDSFSITPWGEYSFLGRDLSLDGGSPFGGMAWEKKSKMWHAGIAASGNITDDLSIKADFIYGALTNSGDGMETSGYFADLKIAYDLGMGKLGLALWYASGDDKNDAQKNEYGSMPSFTRSPIHEIGWGLGVSSFGFWGDNPICYAGAVSQSGVGTMGLSLMIEELSFIENLSHDIRFLYYTGTNDHKAMTDGRALRGGGYAGNITGGFAYLLDKDDLFEINFDHKYQISRGFTATLNFGYVWADWYKESQRSYTANNMWRCTLGFQYAF